MDVLRQPIAQELAQWSSFQDAKLSVEDIARALVRPPKRDMGDVALGCFMFAKAANIKPNEMAAKLAAGGPLSAVREQQTASSEPRLVDSATAAGPYVNLKLNRAAAIERVLGAIEQSCPGDKPESWSFGGSDEGRDKTLVLDFSSPNIAKPLAVHHLRSTMIGNAIKKIRESQGWRVVGVNHLGDWGTGFGKLIAGLEREYKAVERYLRKEMEWQENPVYGLEIVHLNGAYQRYAETAKSDESSEEHARATFAAMERGVLASVFEGKRATMTMASFVEDNRTFMLWKYIRQKSLEAFERAYHELGIAFTDWEYVGALNASANRTFLKQPFPEKWKQTEAAANLYEQNRSEFFRTFGIYVGESFYLRTPLNEVEFWNIDLCTGLIAEWKKAGVVVQSDGAWVIVVDPSKDKDGKFKTPPVILQKSDGATSYHARDMASAFYRWKTFEGTDFAYVVGGEQTLHFKQLFKALEMLGYEWAANCKHVDFGLLLFKQPDGKWAKASTRKGRVIMLEDLLDEAIAAVKEIMSEKNPELSGSAASAEIAQKVGVGAVVFNDLKNGRRNDIKFDWDEILNFQGETGPYMLMQYVRMGSVSDKFAQVYPNLSWANGDVSRLEREDEFELALLLAGFPEAVRRASAEYEPSNVAKALIEIAAQTSSWWTNTKDTRIVGDDAELSRARVRLVNAIRKVLGRGLLLLGISLVERM